MAKPQLEDGHTQIANEILENLMKIHLSANQWQVLLCIIRKTYGFHKKVDYIANSQIVAATSLCKSVVSRCLSELNEKELIIRTGKYIGFQKDWEQWKLAELPTKVSRLANNQELAELLTTDIKLAEQPTSEELAKQPIKLAIPSTKLAELPTKVSSCAVAQKIKDTITKDTIQKKETITNSSQQNIFTTYEQEIGQLTPSISEELKDAEKEYSAEEVVAAIKEAVKAGKRNWRYINGILENWSTQGRRGQKHKASSDPDKFIKGKYGHMVQR